MRRTYALYYVLILLCFSAFRAAAQTDDTLHVRGVVLCKFSDNVSYTLDTTSAAQVALKLLCRKYQVTAITTPCKGLSPSLDRVYKIKLARWQGIDTLIQELEALPYVEYAEKMPAFRNFGFGTPNDFNASDQYFLGLVQAPLMWDRLHGSSSIVVAVVDNGVRLNHEDLSANIWTNKGEIAGNGFDDDLNGYADDVNGYDVADNDPLPTPPSGIADTSGWVHGTHCAGLVSGVTNNGIGISSIGYGLKIMAVKCTGDKDNPHGLDYAIDGIAYALRAKANVISMSFGTTENSKTLLSLIQQAETMGVVMVAAAGNGNTDQTEYPAGYATVLAVAATDQFDKKASFSNYGSWVDVSAPGVYIKSTFPSSTSSYGVLNGTSMATPIVAGLAGVVLSNKPSLKPSQVIAQIQAGCDNIDAQNGNYKGMLGAGRINAAKTFGISSIEDVDPAERASIVYPNPVLPGEEAYISALHNNRISRIELWDAQGRLADVITPEAGGKDTRLAVQNLRAGIYMVKTYTQGTTEIQKLVIQ